jgi:Flp pilus assembly protein TadG
VVNNINKFKKESGQTLVEFALILPILLLLIFGAIEFGRVFHATHVITSAAREGARAAAVGKPNTHEPASNTTSIDSIDEAVKGASGSLVSSTNVYLKTNSSANIDVDNFDSTDPNSNQIFYTVTPYEVIDRTGSTRTQDYVEIKVKGAVDIVIPIINLFFAENPKILETSAQMRLE